MLQLRNRAAAAHVVMFRQMSVRVRLHISWALEDMGEQRSPKKLPERMAPPVKGLFAALI